MQHPFIESLTKRDVKLYSVQGRILCECACTSSKHTILESISDFAISFPNVRNLLHTSSTTRNSVEEPNGADNEGVHTNPMRKA